MNATVERHTLKRGVIGHFTTSIIQIVACFDPHSVSNRWKNLKTLVFPKMPK